MKIPLQRFPQDINNQYKIVDLVDKDGVLYVNIRKGMHDLKQADHIAFECIVKLLNTHGYYPLRSNPGIWCHKMLA